MASADRQHELNSNKTIHFVCDWSLHNFVLTGSDCRVRDPRSGYEFDLSSLKRDDYPVRNGKYIYHLSICGGLQRDVCSPGDSGAESVSSCQVDGKNQKIAGTIFCLFRCLMWYLCHCSVIALFMYVSSHMHLHACRNGKPESDLCGRPDHPELHQWSDLS